MTGHKAAVSVIAFSVDGRFLVSGGNDNRVLGKKKPQQNQNVGL
jgi:WD40 repeat protein